MLGSSSTPTAGAPLSSWQPSPPPTPTVASYLAEDIDPATGEVMSLTTGMDPTDAALVTQARTVRGSGAVVLTEGNLLGSIENNDDSAAERVRFELKRITDPFVARREIEIVSMEISAGEDQGDTGAARVVYRNTRTGGDPLTLDFGS